MSSDKQPVSVVSQGIGVGCLAGLGLALLFLALAGVVYLLIGVFNLANEVRLLVAVAVGPTLGTMLVLIGWYIYATRGQRT